MWFPATQAVNRLIIGDQETASTFSDYRYKNIGAHESLVSVPWPGLVGVDATAECRHEHLDSSTMIRGSFLEDGLRNYLGFDPGSFSFPVIEWCSSEDEVEDDDDDDDTGGGTQGSGQKAVSAPARISGSRVHTKALARGSLVRSISLVSRIMEEMKDIETAFEQPKKFPSFKVHKKKRQFKGLMKANRFVAHTNPDSLVGLRAGQHKAAGKYFL
jgi:hypothetical protein